MHSFLARLCRNHLNRSVLLRTGLALAAAVLFAAAAHAQFGSAAHHPVHDPAALKPPAGATRRHRRV